jgi:hypothetical protein
LNWKPSTIRVKSTNISGKKTHHIWCIVMYFFLQFTLRGVKYPVQLFFNQHSKASHSGTALKPVTAARNPDLRYVSFSEVWHRFETFFMNL